MFDFIKLNNRGSTLGAALILAVFITFLTFGAFTYVDMEVKKVMKLRWDIQAYHYTEEGYKIACWKIFHNDSNLNGYMTEQVGGFTYSRGTTAWPSMIEADTYEIKVETTTGT